MARTIQIIVTGDEELNRMLASLKRTVARRLHRTAARAAAKLILADAKAKLPVATGAYRRSLTVRAMARSRRGMGYRVTQKELRTVAGKKTKIFYGGFIELGWTVGKRHKFHAKKTEDMTLEALIASTKRKLRYKRKLAAQVTLKKIPGRWIIKAAGDRNEAAAIALYEKELRRLIAEES